MENLSHCLSSIVQNSKDAFLIISTDGIITYSNISSSNYFGYSKTNMLGKHISFLFTKKGKKEIESNIHEICNGLQIENYESSIKKNDGKKIYCSVNLTALTDDNLAVVAISVHLRDISSHRASQKEMQNKAKERGTLKDIFIANLNHELRTPANLIIGFSDILLQKKLKHVQQKDYLETIKMAAENLLTLINSMLDSSKIEAGKVDFEKVPFSLSKTFSSLEKMFSLKANEKNIQLHFECDDNIPPVIIGDPNKLMQILTNLLSNAIKFTDEGRVSVNASILVDKNQEKLLHITVEDTGIGIENEMQTHLFERYRQAKNNTTRNYGGTGLGLSIIKKLVELQDGTITFKSEVGVGSEFSFTLPLHTQLKKIKTKKEEVTIEDVLTNKTKLETLKKLKVLMVEDNKLNIKMMEHIFLMQNISLEIAENGIEAIEKVKNNYFDIILMDIEMPLMKGCEATQVIRRDLKNNIPIIALTANTLFGEKEKYLKKGMNGFITKPININLLFSNMYDLVTSEIHIN